MGRDSQAVAGWQTGLALWRGARRNGDRQLQSLSTGWAGCGPEAMRNVLHQGYSIRSRFRTTLPRTRRLPDGGKRISTRFMLHCNIRMAALRSERWRSRQLLLFSDRRSDAPPPAKLRIIGRPTPPPPKGRLTEQRHSSSQPLFIISESLSHLLPRQAFSFFDCFKLCFQASKQTALFHRLSGFGHDGGSVRFAGRDDQRIIR